MLDLNRTFVYDIETYCNVFTLTILNAGSKQYKIFEISEFVDQRQEMISHLREIRKQNGWLVGYNNVGFDYPIIHYILKNQQCSVYEIYMKCQEIISTDFNRRWSNRIATKDELLQQIDLYLINHFDNVAKATSLKSLEIAMRMDDVQDLPFEVGSVLSQEQIKVLKQYNLHDVIATYKFLMHNLTAINFRLSLNDPAKLNANDPRLGELKFVEALEASQKGICYEIVGGRRKARQTKRDKIHLKECIFDYVKFERPEFVAIKEWIASRSISETKGVFSDILESDLGDVAQYAQLTKKRSLLYTGKPTEAKIASLKKKQPMGWVEEKTLKAGKVQYYWCWNVAESLNVVIDGLKYVFGTGGIHASVDGEVVVGNIVDRDVNECVLCW